MSSKILVTGASGYLGGAILSKLKESKDDVIGLNEVNLIDAGTTSQMLDDIKPDIIIHCAAIVPKSINEYNNNDIQSLNLKMIDNLLHRFSGKFIFCSSMTVYNESLKMPVKEDYANGKNLSAYGQNKFKAEQKILSNKNITPVILRLCGLFGGSRQSGLIYNIVKYFKYGGELQLPDNPLLWAAIHVDDAANIIAESIKNDFRSNSIVNVGYDYDFSINKLLNEVANITNKSEIETITHPNFRMDLSILKEASLIPKHSFKERIEEIISIC